MARRRSAKRETANLRLRAGFVEQAAVQVAEFAKTLAEESDRDFLDSLAYDLDSLAETAGSLQLPDIAEAARDAAERVRKGEGSRSVSALGRMLRGTSDRGRIGPIVIVTDAVHIQRFGLQKGRFTEPLALFDSVEALDGHVFELDIAAIALPSSSIEHVSGLVHRYDCPVLVYGPAKNIDARIAAVMAGSQGYLPEPLTLKNVVRVTRRLASAQTHDVLIYVLGPDDPKRAEVVGSLEAANMTVMASTEAPDLLPALEEVVPDALLMSYAVGNYDAIQLIRVVRAHPAMGDIPLLVYGAEFGGEDYLAAGADDVFGSKFDSPAVRVKSRIRRRRAWPAAVRADTGLLDRTTALDRIDRIAEQHRRSHDPLCVVVLVLRGLDAVAKEFGRAACTRAVRLLAGCLDRGLRASDVVGQLSDDAVVVALAGCTEEGAQRRIGEIHRKFKGRCRADRRLRAVQLVAGITDSDLGMEQLVLRAEEAVQKARSGES